VPTPPKFAGKLLSIRNKASPVVALPERFAGDLFPLRRQFFGSVLKAEIIHRQKPPFGRDFVGSPENLARLPAKRAGLPVN